MARPAACGWGRGQGKQARLDGASLSEISAAGAGPRRATLMSAPRSHRERSPWPSRDNRGLSDRTSQKPNDAADAADVAPADIRLPWGRLIRFARARQLRADRLELRL